MQAAVSLQEFLILFHEVSALCALSVVHTGESKTGNKKEKGEASVVSQIDSNSVYFIVSICI